MGHRAGPPPCSAASVSARADVAVFSLQRIEGRVGALQNAVDEYYKAKNEFAAKVSVTRAAKVPRPSLLSPQLGSAAFIGVTAT